MSNNMNSSTGELIGIIFAWIVAGILMIGFGNPTMVIVAIGVTARGRKPLRELKRKLWSKK